MQPSEIEIEVAALREKAIAARDCLRSVLATVGTPTTDRRLDTLRGCAHRAVCWLQSFEALAGPAHFQALLAGARAMFEIALDVTFIAGDSTARSAARLSAWDELVRYRHAKLVLDYSARSGALVPRRAKMEAFVRSIEARVEANRKKYWPDVKHPDRWTGRNLKDDSAEADKIFPKRFEEFRASTFVHWYEIEYRQICWNVHGSGLAGIRGLDAEAFHAFAGQAYVHAQWAGLLTSAFVLEAFGEDPVRNLDFDLLLVRLTKNEVPAQARLVQPAVRMPGAKRVRSRR